ncbi:hypothetical protein PrNR1418_28370 [Providencia rettgeri]|nr:hypothetical protein BML2576_29010 [Providencia rettgeri]BDH19546.1 hypothetical protein PrNR1418_28370 [Providencia rettgeri]
MCTICADKVTKDINCSLYKNDFTAEEFFIVSGVLEKTCNKVASFLAPAHFYHEFDFKLSLCPVIYNVSINTRVDKNEKRFGITSRWRNINVNDG